MSASSASNSASLISPSSRRICAGEQLFAQLRIVVQLGVDGGGDLVEDEAQAADEDGVEDEHLG